MNMNERKILRMVGKDGHRHDARETENDLRERVCYKRD
jgi:hypothetical protein